MLTAKVSIKRFVDKEPQPGLVEAELEDAAGVTHRFIDKVPIFTADALDASSSYPVEGTLAFVVLERRGKTSLISTETPWCVDSVDGNTEFEILNSAILKLPPHPAEVVSIQVGNNNYLFPFNNSIDISIPLKFNGPQPNAYGVETAVSNPCEADGFVGDTRRGGSINFEQYTFIPHCNGTHTECVGHITHERIAINDCLQDVIIPALLISIKPQVTTNNDRIIDRAMLKSAVEEPGATIANRGALIVRTLPNDESKITEAYGTEKIPAYFSAEAIEYIVQCGFRHLLVDMPSIDRIFDEGNLVNHRLFWNVEPGTFETNENTRINNTITELIYVPNEVADGEYLLNLQIAPFQADASPSRPVLFKITSH